MAAAQTRPTERLHDAAATMVAGRRGILAADESIGTMNTRLAKVDVEATEENRRAYREMLVTTPDLATGISGVILCEETFRQRLADGRTFPQALTEFGILPGIKVDAGAKPLPGAPGETVTEGLDGLGPRLAEFAELGARFAKWRAVITIGSDTPSEWALQANAHALARYAVACQDAGIVPIVEPEVLMDGGHGLSRCAEVTTTTLQLVFRALAAAGVDLAGTVLKPNMVVPGAGSAEARNPEEIAAATVDVLCTCAPDDLAGVAFLSGGQGPVAATENLAAMQQLTTPWPLTFSFGRALVEPALNAWRGAVDRVADGQAALAGHVEQNAAVLRDRTTAGIA